MQDETFGHRGRKSEPLYRCRRLLTKADERLDDKSQRKLLGLLRAGDPHGEVATAWHAKEADRELYGVVPGLNSPPFLTHQSCRAPRPDPY